MHKLAKSAIIFALVMTVIGIDTVRQQGRVDSQIEKRSPQKTDSQALSLPKGEIAAGTETLERPGDGTVGGTVILTGEPMPGAVRLTWKLGGVSTPYGLRLARSSQSFPSVINDESVEAPAGSASFLWRTPTGVWNFRLCVPDTPESGNDCLFYSNNVTAVVPAVGRTGTAEGTVPTPSQELINKWAEGVGSLSLEVTGRDDGLLLRWTSLDSPSGFRSYRIVRSETNPQPSWPADGFIVQIGDLGFSSYLDREAEPGRTYYYRVCAEKIDRTVTCGNPAVGKR